MDGDIAKNRASQGFMRRVMIFFNAYCTSMIAVICNFRASGFFFWVAEQNFDLKVTLKWPFS
jgi:hypothetical protein